MKILLINTSERTGGAGIACNRLMQALNKHGHEAKMLVRDKKTNDKNVIPITNSWFQIQMNFIRFVWERLCIFLVNRFNKKNLFAVSLANTGINISNHPLVKDADILHLHWINQGFLSIKNVQQLIETGKPIVWTLHDMWPLTGICHHARTCDRFTFSCGNCFFLHKPNSNDLSHQVFNEKQKVYSKTNIHFVGCSQWITNKAKSGKLTQNQSVISIPNSIDINKFRQTDKTIARKKLNLPLNKKLLLFGALNISDKRKGIDYLSESLHIIQQNNPRFFDEIELVVFGQVKSEVRSLFTIPIHSMGYLTDEENIISLYNAVDVFVTSSLEENLPNTIMEAMACGVPCIGFNIGGIPEMIDHEKNGYVAEYQSAEDLSKGIYRVLSEADYSSLSAHAIHKVNENYSEEIIAQKYSKLYVELMQEK